MPGYHVLKSSNQGLADLGILQVKSRSSAEVRGSFPLLFSRALSTVL